MKKNTDLGRVITAMVTPFKDGCHNHVDYFGAMKLANHLLQNGTDTLLLTGSTGEAAQMTDNEKRQLINAVHDNIPSNAKIMVSTGDTNTNRVIEKSKNAFNQGADAVLVSVPEYIKPPQKDLYEHFSRVAKSVSGRAVFVYNIPGRTGTEILPETVARLAHDHPNIVGIKQSMPDLDKVSEMRMMCPAEFQIYSGDDSLTLPMLSLGAKGVISVASHLQGQLINDMIKAFNTNPKTAAEIHQLLFPLFKALFSTTNPIPIKQALYHQGLIDSPVLRTLGTMTETDKEKLHSALQSFEEQKTLFLPKTQTKNK